MKVFFLLSSTVAGLKFIENVNEFKHTFVADSDSIADADSIADSDSTPEEARRVPSLKNHFTNIIGNIPTLDDLYKKASKMKVTRESLENINK